MENQTIRVNTLLFAIGTYMLFSVGCGLITFFFIGNINFFGEQGFHPDISYFFYGLFFGGLYVSPIMTAIVMVVRFLISKEQTQAREDLLCPACRKPIDKKDAFCRHCGTPVQHCMQRDGLKSET